ncbi:ECF-type sigma factor [Dokdonella ginsengisoli]|uniref:ECF-type sigma factor n=1 Tax=Dokdonella ginsengisoli TaxID=363846 RepID=A0ABV9QSY2_9GAMM
MTGGSADGDVTRLLLRWSQGDDDALDRLTPLIYEELKTLASRELARERADHTLQTTALVNEAFARMIGHGDTRFENRAHFAAIAARAMRRVLVDHARRRRARKRPTSDERVSIEEIDLEGAAGVDLIGLDLLLERLAQISPRQAKVVDMKFFAGLELEQIADLLDVARPTVVRDWRMARAWLQRELS